MEEKTVPCFFSIHEKDPSYQVSYEITNVCNLNCGHCCNKSTSEAFAGMPIGRILQMIDELASLRINSIYLSGGEPTKYPHFNEVVDYVHAKGIDLALATNATEIDDVLPVLKTFSQTREGVFVSLDGLYDTHDTLRGREGAFEKSVRSIRLLVQNRVPVRISTVIWKGNVSELEDIVLFCGSLGVYKVHFSMLFDTGRAAENDVAIPASQYGEICRKVEALSDKYSREGFSISMKRNRSLLQGCDYCHGAEKIIHINSRGRVFPCSWIAKTRLGEKYSFQWEPGNMRERLSQLLGFQDLVQKRIRLHGVSGCPAVAFQYHGAETAPDPLNDFLQ